MFFFKKQAFLELPDIQSTVDGQFWPKPPIFHQNITPSMFSEDGMQTKASILVTFFPLNAVSYSSYYFSQPCQFTRPKYASVSKCEQRVLRLTKICLIIQGDLCFEKAYKAISAVCLQVCLQVCLHYLVTWPILFTKTMTWFILGNLCLELAVKTNYRQNQLFVYKTLFTLLGHMTNFVYKSHDTNYTM